MIDQYQIDNTDKYKQHKMKQKQRGREKGEAFVSSVCSIINLSPVPGLKEASVERNNVLCMEVSEEENK